MPHIQTLMPGHDRAKSLGHLAAAWVEHYYRFGVGDLAGSRYSLDEDFYLFLVDAYALGENGRRLYRIVVLSRPKGTAKSELASAIALFDALGPSRFDGWAEGGEVFSDGLGFEYEYLPGEPMGRPVVDPIVRIMATEEKQTGNTYANIRMVLEDEGEDRSALADWFKNNRDLTVTKEGITLGGAGQIVVSTAGAKSKDGGKETLAIADETHLYTNKLAAMYNTVRRNLKKRRGSDPWVLATTTMYQDGEESIAEVQHKQALKILEGKANNPGLLFDHREGTPIKDLTDEEALLASLREGYGGRDWIDYDGIIADAKDGTGTTQEFRRYFLNQLAGSRTAYVTSNEMAAITSTDENPVRPLEKGDVITIGMDYAPGNRGEGRGAGTDEKTRTRRRFRVPDATAIVACRLEDMTFHPLGIWEVEDEEAALRDGWNPPILDIDQTVHAAFKDYTVVGMYADPSGIESYLDRWTQKYLKQLKVRASEGRPMYRYMSGKSAAAFSRVIEDLYRAIADQSVRVVADKTLIRHFLNARRAVTPQGVALYKENPESPRKIDGVLATALAFIAARDAINKGVQTRKRAIRAPRRIY